MAQDLTRFLAYCGRNMGVEGPTVTELGLLAGCSMLKEPQLRALLAKVGPGGELGQSVGVGV